MKYISMLLLLFSASATLAQSTSSALSTDPQQIENIIQSQGCRYEVSAAAQTIAQLQRQINDLQKQLDKLDPKPKPGATKH